MPPLRTAEALHRQGSRVIHRGPQNVAQIREWLRAADEKLKDAENLTVSKGTRMDAAYDVVLCCGLSVLGAQGWRAGSEPGHHAEVLEAMSAALGLKDRRSSTSSTPCGAGATASTGARSRPKTPSSAPLSIGRGAFANERGTGSWQITRGC